MKRWIKNLHNYGENPKVDAFLNEIKEVCYKHNLSLSHEDQHGSFEVENLNQINITWLLDANDNSKD